MNGYFKDREATMAVIDRHGYFHTGDTGRIDSEGFLYITGRIKELIITTGGENIAPVIIEDTIKTFCNAISNIMVVGENQRYLAALITLKTDMDLATGTPTKNLTLEARAVFKQTLGLDLKTTDEAIANESVQKYIN